MSAEDDRIGSLRLSDGQHTCVSSVSCYVYRIGSGVGIVDTLRIRAWCHRILLSGGDIPGMLYLRQAVRSARLRGAVQAIGSDSWPLFHLASLVIRLPDHEKLVENMLAVSRTCSKCRGKVEWKYNNSVIAEKRCPRCGRIGPVLPSLVLDYMD